MARKKIQFIPNPQLPDSLLNIFKNYNLSVEKEDNSISLGSKARDVIRELNRLNKIHPHIQELTNKDFSKSTFGLYHSLLASLGNITKGRYIMLPHGIFNINNIDYHITNDWYNDESRSHLQFLYDWCESLYK